MVATPTTKHMNEAEYQEFALGDPGGQWELIRGQLREKPGMSVEHGGVMDHVLAILYDQLDRSKYRIRTTHARLRRSADTYYVPAIAVIPIAAVQALRTVSRSLDAYPESLPLVVEIWSPSTGWYDIREKLPDYQARGDREIWYIHPYELTLTAWRRRPDGTYSQTVYREGTVRLESIPGVAFEVEALFGL